MISQYQRIRPQTRKLELLAGAALGEHLVITRVAGLGLVDALAIGLARDADVRVVPAPERVDNVPLPGEIVQESALDLAFIGLDDLVASRRANCLSDKASTLKILPVSLVSP